MLKNLLRTARSTAASARRLHQQAEGAGRQTGKEQNTPGGRQLGSAKATEVANLDRYFKAFDKLPAAAKLPENPVTRYFSQTPMTSCRRK